MELSRRDAIAALSAAGITVGAATLAWERLSDTDTVRLSARDRRRLLALAEVVYPSAIENVSGFVETYVVGRALDRPAYADGMAAALTELDDVARDWHDTSWLDLTATEREKLLTDLGVHQADPDPGGLAAQRIRYYLVNELHYALYSTPTGGRLVGIENPIGHPGGLGSYTRPAPAPTAESETEDGSNG